jgi:hypothetical protein
MQEIGSYGNAAGKQRRRRQRGGKSGKTPYDPTHTATPYGRQMIGLARYEVADKSALISFGLRLWL